MQLNLTDFQAGGIKGTIEVSETVFEQPFNESLVHQIVTAYLAKARAGTHAQKSRSAVSGGGKKPWKQKGTGNARAGTTRSPIWRKGGVTFASSTRDYAQKVNKKMYRVGMRSIFSELTRQNRIVIVESINLLEAKTKQLLKQFKSLDLSLESSGVLVVIDSYDKNLDLASRNLPKVNVCNVEGLEPVSLINHNKVLITVPALKKLEEGLG